MLLLNFSINNKIGNFMTIRVYYEDTDAGGVVYHSQYLNFCERARSEIFFSQGSSPHRDNQFFVVKSLSCNYIKSAKFADILEVKTKVIQIKKASMVLKQEIFRDGKVIFDMDVTVVYLIDGKPSKIPDFHLDIFGNY
jgi:acyl-CoA thioester hydrolase